MVTLGHLQGHPREAEVWRIILEVASDFRWIINVWLAWKGHCGIPFKYISRSQLGELWTKPRKMCFEEQPERQIHLGSYFCCPCGPSLWYSSMYQVPMTAPGWVSRQDARSWSHWYLHWAPLCWCHSPPPHGCNEGAGWWSSQNVSAWTLTGGLGC